jgi:thioredoxin-dependent peroxiredoxin
MKKILLASAMVLSLLGGNTCFGMQITSDANGPVTISEPQLNVGDAAPTVTLPDHNFKKVTVGGATGKVQIISTIESFYTSVCDDQTMQLNAAQQKMPNVQIAVLTANMPFVVDAYQTDHKINNIQLLSTFNDATFGKQYGVQVVGGELTGILARSIFVINKQGKVVYKEITSNIDKMPNLAAALKAAEQADKA